LIVVLLLISLTTDCIVEGFLVATTTATSNSNFPISNYQLRSLFHDRVFTPSSLASSSRLKATKEEDHLTEEETWSRSGSGDEKSSSRFGVRKRVRAVLEKAKNRTGINNVNSSNGEADDSNDNDKLFSIGGFDGDPDLVSTPTSSNGSNGASAPTANGASINGSAAPVNGSSAPVNGSAAPVNGSAAPANGSAAPVNRSAAPVNGSVAPVNGSVAPLNGSVAPVEYQASESSAKKPSKGNAAIPGEILTGQVNKMLNSNLPEEPLEPLPFTLPQITQDQRDLLANGERIQEQSKMGREGSGFVVLDVKAPPYAVWECLLDFEAYPENIGTVRSMNMFTSQHLKSSYIAEKPVLPGTGRATRRYGNASITRAKFVLSKFRLNIAAIHKYRPHPDGHYMVFTLDRACTNAVLQDAKGIWYTQSNPDERGEEYTRVWLFCEVKVSPMLPSFIVDYAANRAMPRATTWLKPTVEAAAKEWLKND
jgi:hypothetical protein